MRRWIIYLAAAVLLLLIAPIKKTDVGDLLPVELLYIYRSQEGICVETDTESLGMGSDLQAAMEDLEETAEGTIFLETTDYLILTEETKGLLPELYQLLRPGTEVCLGENADVQAAGFLKTHKPGITLGNIRAGNGTLPVLSRIGERYRLVSGK